MVVYQPVVDLSDRKPVGFEALSRFRIEPKRSPDVWFAAAARAGRGVELELLAMRRALAGLAALPEDAYVTVNASPSTILAPELRRVLLDAPLPRVVLEVTEQEEISCYDKFSAALAPLRQAGLRLAVDDVGAGFASLMHMVRLAPDMLKLDRAVTSDLPRSRRMRAMAAALTSFAIEIGSTVLAEGIETDEQLAVVEALGIALGQGYLLGRPEPLPVRVSRHTGV